MILLLLGAALAAPLTLDQAREMAAESALSVERARATADASRADAAAVLGGTLPAVAGFVDVTTGQGRTAFGFDRPVSTLAGVGLEASWTVVDPAGWAGAGAARQTARGADAMADWAMVEARQEATVSYTAAWAAREEVSAWQESERDAAEATEAVRALVEAGLRPPADLARFQAEGARVRAERVDAEGRAAARCAELNGLIRREIGEDCDLAAPALGDPLLQASRHPALLAAEAALRAAEGGRRAAAWDLGPTVSASGTAAQYTSGGNSGPGWSAGLGVDVPIAAGGAGHAAARAEKAREHATAVALEEQETALEVARVSAEAALDSARAGLEAREKALRSARAARDLVEERYNAGLEDLVAWLDARRSEQDAAVALTRAEAALGLAVAAVEAARGVR